MDGARCLGVINVEHETAGALNQSDRDLLTTLSHDAIMAIRNAQLYLDIQHRAKVLELLYDVGQQFSADLDLPRVLEAVVVGAAKILEADLATLFVRKVMGLNPSVAARPGFQPRSPLYGLSMGRHRNNTR